MFAFKYVFLEINRKILANLNRKILNFRVYKKCLDGSDYQKKCDSYIIRSKIHEMYFQQTQKSRLTPFDDKRCH